MDARAILWSIALAIGLSAQGYAQQVVGPPGGGNRRVVFDTTHFRVFANDPRLAQEVGQMAEEYRRHLAMHWLGRPLPAWEEKVPVVVHSSPRMPASGETKYTLVNGSVRNFQMVLCGSPERILDSVLPHEMTHTVLATHFAASGKPVPRWADEGACTTVEHASERNKHDAMLVRFLSEGRGIPFKMLFAMRDYPPDMMPLYAQGYSLCAFLIAQGGPRRFIQFLERGMQNEDWVTAVSESYGYPKLGSLKVAWNDWVSDGGGSVNNYTASALGFQSAPTSVVGIPASSAAIPASAVAFANDSIVDSNVRLANAMIPVPGPNAQADSPSLRLLQQDIASRENQVATASATTEGSMTSGSSFYRDQFLLHRGAQVRPESLAIGEAPSSLPTGQVTLPTGFGQPLSMSPSPLPSGQIPVHAAQPGPMQTMGGPIYR